MNSLTHTIVKNLDFSLRAHKAKSVIVISDYDKEGKSTFLKECIPLLSELYDRKILIVDCQSERGDILEISMTGSSAPAQFVHQTQIDNLNYIHVDDLFFLETLPQPEKVSALAAYYNEVSKNYDVVFINTKTPKKSTKHTLPSFPIDGAIVIRSKKSISKKSKDLTSELADRDIPVLGFVMNGGL